MPNKPPDKATTWAMILAERSALVDVLDTLTPAQWETKSLCAPWTVHLVAGHILAGAEQSAPHFLKGMAVNGFRFNAMIAGDARRYGLLSPSEIVSRLRVRTTTTNGPPAPPMAMLGEVVVHGADLLVPLGISPSVSAEAAVACLDMYAAASFPVGGKKRIRGLRLTATDVDWSFGDGPAVTGSAVSLLLAMTGRKSGWEGLSGEGVSILGVRVTP